MTRVLILHPAQSENAAAMAKAIYEGTVLSGASVSQQQVFAATSDDPASCDAVASGISIYFSYIARAIKTFSDCTFFTPREARLLISTALHWAATVEEGSRL